MTSRSALIWLAAGFTVLTASLAVAAGPAIDVAIDESQIEHAPLDYTAIPSRNAAKP